jgi:hypothetical protein
MFLPAITKVTSATVRGQALLRCAYTALALERYRQKHGRWPDDLPALVPGQLGALPLDPYDGKPLRYRRTGRGVIIYSVGADVQDNGGNLDRKRFNQPGTDIGLRLWDVAHRRQPPRNPEVGPPRPLENSP